MLVLAAARQELGDLDGEVVGVGPIVAAARAAAILARRQPSRVLLIGTGSAYARGPDVGQVVVARRIGLSYGVAAMGLGYVPRAPTPIDTDPAMTDALGLSPVSVLTVGAVTTDETLGRRLSDGWQVEHLEAFGVALACKEAGVPFAACLGVASRAGPDAHVQWLTHRDEAQQAAREQAQRLLS